MDKSSTKTALVTGASGFIGSHLVRRLIREEWQVHIIVRQSSNLDGLNHLASQFHVHVHDGTTERMMDVLLTVKPTVVFHLASFFLAQHRSDDIPAMIQSNVLFSTQLAEAMTKAECRFLVNAGTSWQSFENEVYNPVCLYAATKQAFEDILTFYVRTTPLDAVTLRLFDTYGPGDTRKKLLPMLMRVAFTGERLEMSPGDQLLDMVFIDDVASGFLRAASLLLDAQVPGHTVYALSSGAPVSLRTLVGAVERATGESIHVAWGERPYREREVMVPWNTGVPLPGWRPVVGLEQGLNRLVSSIRNDMA